MRSSRRHFLGLVASIAPALLTREVRAANAAGESDNGWNQADLAHLIPLANHDEILIKASFRRPLHSVPRLYVGNARVDGARMDTAGRFWRFRARGLHPGTRYELRLEQAAGGKSTDPWTLRTFPAPDADVGHLRILAYTCAGGNERLQMASGERFFLNMPDRRRLLRRGLGFEPDVVIANGDHVYWDQRTILNKPESFSRPWLELFEEYGEFDRDRPVLGSANEEILKRVVDDQVTSLYGVSLRSVPSYFLSDDHDMFDNDEANDQYFTLPPDRHMLDAARTTQRLYYPEFPPDATRDARLPGAGLDRSDDLSEVFGTLRYGRLFECLLYDTKRYLSLKGPAATMVPPEVEAWLARRTAADDVRHLAHMPSTPIGWSAGKWGEWYPDVLGADGVLGTATAKPYWPAGWWAQHQRILGMLADQAARPPVVLSGDLHALSCGKIVASGDLDLRSNPVHTACVGPLGSSGPGFPSQYRGIGATVPTGLTMEESLPPLEKNGFSIIDVSPASLRIRFFAWRPPEPSAEIDAMSPLYDHEIAR